MNNFKAIIHTDPNDYSLTVNGNDLTNDVIFGYELLQEIFEEKFDLIFDLNNNKQSGIQDFELFLKPTSTSEFTLSALMKPESLTTNFEITSYLARLFKSVDIIVYHGLSGGIEFKLYDNRERFNKVFPGGARKRVLEKILNSKVFGGWFD